MKKLFNLALFGAIALTGAFGFSSCSSSNDEVIDNPNYDPETNTVKTEFTLSLPNYFGSSTRQTATVAQTTGNFRGMQNMVLIPFNATTISDGTEPWKGKVYNLGTIGTTSTDADYWDKETQKAKVYRSLDVPIETNRFIFYGQSKVSGTEVTDKFNDGVINPPTSGYSGAISTYNFTLQPILTSYSFDSDTKGKAICSYLKAIRVTTTGISSTALISLLNSFLPKAASSASVQAAVDALWKQVIAIPGLSDADKNTIKGRIEGTSNSNATIDADNNVTLNAVNLTGYPANLYLPDGAVAISWTDPTNPAINASDMIDTTPLTNYVYPAALYYRANSTIGVSDKDKVSEKYEALTWDQILASTDATGPTYTWNASVSANTRSIALHDQIQYAVGRLDLSIKAKYGTLYDRDGTAVTVDATNGFRVSAVLVGGQKDVGYDFTPKGTTSYTIYDNVMNNNNVAAKVDGESAPSGGVNHTLVLETAATPQEVKVAVEMTNNTETAFMGKDGIVPIGGKFYLVGSLKLGTSGNVTSGSNNKIFEQDVITKAVLTITQGKAAASLGDGEKNTTGLGAAYNVLPDLTVSNLEVAFSVNLEWQTGLTFEVGL